MAADQLWNASVQQSNHMLEGIWDSSIAEGCTAFRSLRENSKLTQFESSKVSFVDRKPVCAANAVSFGVLKRLDVFEDASILCVLQASCITASFFKF